MKGNKLDVVDLVKTGVWGGVEPLLRKEAWEAEGGNNQVAGRRVITMELGGS